VWPHDGASDVPLDAPLVIAAFDLNRVGRALVAEDGTTIELAERVLGVFAARRRQKLAQSVV
jgi:hypothetical protein